MSKKIVDPTKLLRNRLLSWHNSKSKTISIVDLMDSNFQAWRRRIEIRLENHETLDFRDAIRSATMDELQRLDILILEDREHKKRGK